MEAFPDIRTLIPHGGPSVLLQTVLSAGPEGAECRATISVDHPYMTSSGVHPLLAIELLAQAAAVQRALDGQLDSPVSQRGQLAAADVKVRAQRLPAPATLLVRVTKGIAFGSLMRFFGQVYLEGAPQVLVAHGQVSVAGDETSRSATREAGA